MLDIDVMEERAAPTHATSLEAKINPELLAMMRSDMLIRINAVCSMTGLSVPTIYRLMSRGDFPRPLRITKHARGWRFSEIGAWIDSRPRMEHRGAEHSK
jgi:prophage regulatory protein